jgi:zinc/manganese transport system substrate-binding protein
MPILRILALCAAGLLALAAPAAAAERIKVVASFSILADFVKNVGGERVELSSLVGPDGDAHVYTPTPADAKKISDARLVIVNGLGFEGWLPRLVKSAGGNPTVVEAASGIKTRRAEAEAHDHGHHHDKAQSDADPHGWQSVANARIYVANIRDALAAADPAGAAVYRDNADAYLQRLDALDREVRDAVAAIPAGRRKVISTHDAFGYFAAAYGIQFIAPQGVSTESEVSARDLAAIIRQIRTEKIPAVFLESISDPRMMRRISSETGAKIGGTLYSDSLSGENGEVPTYIELVRHNIKALTRALSNE